jgi:hypothetical protein
MSKARCRNAANLDILKEIQSWKRDMLTQRQSQGGSRGKHFAANLNKVMNSVRAYPLPIRTRDEAELLVGVGPAVSARIMGVVEQRSSTHIQDNEKKEQEDKQKRLAKKRKPTRTLSAPHRFAKSPSALNLTTPQLQRRRLERANSMIAVSSSPSSVNVPFTKEDWEVVLLLDTREVRTFKDRNFFEQKLHQLNVNVELRMLPLGDMVWIVRPKIKPGQQKDFTKEYVTGFVVERKQVGDLAGSIVDGRYLAQKYRLKRCGLRRVVYLVEGKLGSQDKLPEQSLRTALVQTSTLDGYKIQRMCVCVCVCRAFITLIPLNSSLFLFYLLTY